MFIAALLDRGAVIISFDVPLSSVARISV